MTKYVTPALIGLAAFAVGMMAYNKVPAVKTALGG